MVALVAAPAWAPACMDAEEWALWERANRSLSSSLERATRPCADCPLGHAADMRAIGQCNGTPGGVEDEEDEGAERTEGPVVVGPLVALPAITEGREEPGREDDMDRTGPTEAQAQAWELITVAGLTQVQAAARLGITQAGVQKRLLGYQKATGLTGRLPGYLSDKGPRFVRVPAKALDAPTTSAPAPLEPATEASPSSVDRDPTDEPVASPAPADPSPGAGDGDPSADGGLLHPSAGQTPGAGDARGMASPADPGTGTALAVADILDAEVARLATECRALDQQARELAARQAAAATLHDAAVAARDAYRAFLGVDA